METQIFKTQEEFNRRTDKRLNGCGEYFSKVFGPDEMNTCKGCWECEDCTCCENCESCKECVDCDTCVNCKNCEKCEDCTSCYKLVQETGLEENEDEGEI